MNEEERANASKLIEKNETQDSTAVFKRIQSNCHDRLDAVSKKLEIKRAGLADIFDLYTNSCKEHPTHTTRLKSLTTKLSQLQEPMACVASLVDILVDEEKALHLIRTISSPGESEYNFLNALEIIKSALMYICCSAEESRSAIEQIGIGDQLMCQFLLAKAHSHHTLYQNLIPVALCLSPEARELHSDPRIIDVFTKSTEGNVNEWPKLLSFLRSIPSDQLKPEFVRMLFSKKDLYKETLKFFAGREKDNSYSDFIQSNRNGFSNDTISWSTIAGVDRLGESDIFYKMHPQEIFGDLLARLVQYLQEAEGLDKKQELIELFSSVISYNKFIPTTRYQLEFFRIIINESDLKENRTEILIETTHPLYKQLNEISELWETVCSGFIHKRKNGVLIINLKRLERLQQQNEALQTISAEISGRLAAEPQASTYLEPFAEWQPTTDHTLLLMEEERGSNWEIGWPHGKVEGRIGMEFASQASRDHVNNATSDVLPTGAELPVYGNDIAIPRSIAALDCWPEVSSVEAKKLIQDVIELTNLCEWDFIPQSLQGRAKLSMIANKNLPELVVAQISRVRDFATRLKTEQDQITDRLKQQLDSLKMLKKRLSSDVEAISNLDETYDRQKFKIPEHLDEGSVQTLHQIDPFFVKTIDQYETERNRIIEALFVINDKINECKKTMDNIPDRASESDLPPEPKELDWNDEDFEIKYPEQLEQWRVRKEVRRKIEDEYQQRRQVIHEQIANLYIENTSLRSELSAVISSKEKTIILEIVEQMIKKLENELMVHDKTKSVIADFLSTTAFSANKQKRLVTLMQTNVDAVLEGEKSELLKQKASELETMWNKVATRNFAHIVLRCIAGRHHLSRGTEGLRVVRALTPEMARKLGAKTPGLNSMLDTLPEDVVPISASFEPGQRVLLTGPNGGGKSTTVSAIEHARYRQYDMPQAELAQVQGGLFTLEEARTTLDQSLFQFSAKQWAKLIWRALYDQSFKEISGVITDETGEGTDDLARSCLWTVVETYVRQLRPDIHFIDITHEGPLHLIAEFMLNRMLKIDAQAQPSKALAIDPFSRKLIEGVISPSYAPQAIRPYDSKTAAMAENMELMQSYGMYQYDFSGIEDRPPIELEPQSGIARERDLDRLGFLAGGNGEFGLMRDPLSKMTADTASVDSFLKKYSQAFRTRVVAGNEVVSSYDNKIKDFIESQMSSEVSFRLLILDLIDSQKLRSLSSALTLKESLNNITSEDVGEINTFAKIYDICKKAKMPEDVMEKLGQLLNIVYENMKDYKNMTIKATGVAITEALAKSLIPPETEPEIAKAKEQSIIEFFKTRNWDQLMNFIKQEVSKEQLDKFLNVLSIPTSTELDKKVLESNEVLANITRMLDGDSESHSYASFAIKYGQLLNEHFPNLKVDGGSVDQSEMTQSLDELEDIINGLIYFAGKKLHRKCLIDQGITMSQPSATSYTEPTISISEGVDSEVMRLLQEQKRVYIPQDFEHTSFSQASPQVCLVTGPNAEGKSSLIRLMGKIAVYSKLWGEAPCKEHTLSSIDGVAISINVPPDPKKGLSGLTSQAVDLAEMVDMARQFQAQGKNLLAIIDEAYLKTAYMGKTNLSAALIKQLVDTGALVFISTHDRLLPVRLEEINQSLNDEESRIRFGLITVEDHEVKYDSQGQSVPQRIFAKEMRELLPEQVVETIIDASEKLEHEVRSVLYPSSLQS